nr:metal ABC transporter permease [Salinibacterium sp.]
MTSELLTSELLRTELLRTELLTSELLTTDFWSSIFNFTDYGRLLALVQNSLIAGAVLGIVGGLIGVFVMQRDMAFAVHGISELSFAGAAAALLFGANVVAGSLVGSLIAATIIGILGARARDRNSIIGVLMPFGLGLGILFLALYPGRSGNRFGLLTGQILSVDIPQLGVLVAISVVVLAVLLVIWRPLVFDSVDPDVAMARGVPARTLSIVFMILLGLMVAVSVQIIGALLVLALLVTPAAAALRVSSSPVVVPLLAMLFGFVSAVGGILLALGGSLPISPYVTTISFLIYLGCRIAGRISGNRLRRRPEPNRPAAGVAV